MNFLELAQTRFSVRSYKNTAVEKEKLHQILEAGRYAPSAVNFQPWLFVVVQNKDKLAQLCQAYHHSWIQQAPVIIVACSDHSASWKRSSDGKDSADIDIAISVDHMTLMASSLGLGTCWVCNFNTNKCSEFLHLPPHIEPVVMLPLGYPNAEIPQKKRKPLSMIAYKNSFENPFD